MSAKTELNIHVKFQSQTFILISSRYSFLKKVSEKCGLNEDEIEIYDLKNKKFIGISDLTDFIKVQIMEKASCALNGRSHSPVPSTSKKPDEKEIMQKLVDNRTLTGSERAYIIELMEGSNYPPLKRRKTDDSDARPIMKNKKVQVDAVNLNTSRSYSTQTDELINYEPPLNNTINAESFKTQSKKMAAMDKMDAAVATDLMAQSFNKRRNFILIERPIVTFVKEQYPLLFSNSEVKNEIDRIFYVGKCEEFIGNIEKYSSHILSIARDDDPLLLKTKSKMDAFKTPAQKKYAQDVGALLMISSLVHEDRSFLKLKDKDCNPGDFPYIACQARQDDLYFDNHLFRVFVERSLLCEASDFKDAILCLLASYFIFNIKYPDTTFNTLVAFEKLFLEANDTDEADIDLAVRQIIRSIQLKWQAKSGS